tara:strand:+ start:11965 stop:12441 length:477 start_codon:yes stop_codon:yes gene_type:complete
MFTVITFTKDTKYIQQGLDLALKAVHERGLNNIDFDKTDFIDKCKMLYVSPAAVKWGLLKDGKMVGFVIGTIQQSIWFKDPYIKLLACHVDVSYRCIEAYQSLLNVIYNYAGEKKIIKIEVDSEFMLLGASQNLSFLLKNGFQETTQVWEKQIDHQRI